jgi:glycosyltransferase involved in cell wall biosynthesis
MTASSALRVAMVATRAFPSLGGIETHVSQVAPRLSAAGVDVTVLTNDPGWRLPASELVSGVRVTRFRAWPPNPDYAVAPGIYRAITRGRWDLVHCQGYQTLTAPLAMWAAGVARLPYLVTLHSGGHSTSLRNALMRVQWKALRPRLLHAERLVAVSNFEAAFFAEKVRLPLERFTVIPNGSSLPQVPPAEPSDGGPLIASVGRLERYKGHHRVLAAFPRVLQRFPEARLRIAGGGPEGPWLRRMAADLGIADRVAVGPVPPSDRQAMASLLSQAALVVLLSEYESQAIALHEALSLGRPVLVAYTSALRELADRSLAAAVPLTASDDEIAAAILRQLRLPRMPIGLHLPTWDDCASALLELYRKVIRSPIKELVS